MKYILQPIRRTQSCRDCVCPRGTVKAS